MRRWVYGLVLGLLFSAVSSTGGGRTTNAQTSTNCQAFSQTKQQVCGKFLAYWQGHGGLAQQGYPISPEFVEISSLNGKPYTVQYFERAVFELHPENQPPYDVLLSQLGTYELQRAGTPKAIPDASTNCRSFPQTKQQVCGKLLTYWQDHGGLAQQGYPISPEFQSYSELDSKLYTMQYFERSVFELHPENKAPYDLLLSQVGTFRFRRYYSADLLKAPSKAGTGAIIGTLSFPSEGLPPFHVYAIATQGSQYYAVRTILDQGQFRIDGVAPGTYHLVAYIDDPNFEAQRKFIFGFTQTAICTAQPCTDHTLINVPVAAGQVVGGASLTDYSTEPGVFPPQPSTH